ncbi:hypothetical protein GCM10009765_74190 [Fodinicola feengrottensis]|uniref:Hydrophobic protein n=2 Tax=Fodinicola feengrottensis TaxID=435914 RepID=A0ABP4UYJ4_9ACTN
MATRFDSRHPWYPVVMPLLIIVLVLALLLGGAGFALHALWYIAAIVLVVWIVGFFVRVAGGSRWYRW